jgi:diguanylate cyclase (GGDEF)-like protein/PAS domain S-box-containing protein
MKNLSALVFGNLPAKSGQPLTPRHLLGFLAASTLAVALLASLWKFGFEETMDPYLPGLHAVDSLAERWEFVISCSLFALLSLVIPSIVGYRLLTEHLAALRFSSEVFTAAPQPMAVADAKGHIVAVNLAFEQLTGRTSETLLGHPTDTLWGLEAAQELPLMVREELAAHGAWSGEVRNQRPDNSTYVVWLSIKAARDPQGVVREYIASLTDITWRKQREESTLHLAMHDPLTDLANRRMFMEHLQQVTAAARVSGEILAVLFIDLDDFKQINDHLGHAIGDEVLKTVAHRLRTRARSADLVARFGGDEFVMLLRNIESQESAILVAERCRQAVEQPLLIDGLSINIGASIGRALSGHQVLSADSLLERADSAMYEVKKQRRMRTFSATSTTA